MRRPFRVVLGLVVALGLGALLGRYAPDPLKGLPSETKWDFWAVIISVATLAIAILAVLIAIASIYGVVWGREWLEGRIRREAENAVAAVRTELEAYLVGYVGYIFGRLRELLEQLRPHDFIGAAINYTQLAFDQHRPESEGRLIAANNLAFYYAYRGRPSDAQEAIRLAELLLENYPRHRVVDWLTTYAAVVAGYHRQFPNTIAALKKAIRMMEELEERTDVTPEQKQHAVEHLEKLRPTLAIYSG